MVGGYSLPCRIRSDYISNASQALPRSHAVHANRLPPALAVGSVKNYIANENDVENTVCDFIKFCDFVENEKPYATEKGDLSVKACCELNKRLCHPEPYAKATDRMEKYPSIYLWFAVAVNAGIIVRTDAKGGKTALYHNRKVRRFQKNEPLLAIKSATE